jgi:hypothetical protein
MAKFNKNFNVLLCQALQFPEDQLVSIYTTNLQDPLKIDVEMWRLGSLLDAMSLARSCECRAQWTPPTYQRPVPAIPSTAPPGHALVATLANPPCRTLTPVTMANRHEQSLCYNCDEPFVPGHRYKKLCVLEIDQDAVDGV